ncbi:MAG: hypothetical protein HOU81_21115 [Hamadaea sp.]|uniref:hypothetical protein n=1 Tax=Hamadaea sp. TaxID=2024425 RepID=UPI0017AA42FC|nr:hypothetical protein [Hamadaea sp.]NUR73326.1 hypothetical protein [Hamadaea sp.]NUT21306.1 hypothetical protein [Hamadaea sp.]
MNWLDAVGWIGSALLVWSLLQTRILRLRAINLVGCVVLIGFNWALGVWPMVGLNTALAVINIYFLVKLLRTRHSPAAYSVVQVAADDDYLAHVLAVHGQDIARFNPGFELRGTAFLVVRGDETVGVVALHDGGNGVAVVDLDYVTPKYRDFTPGEFVYRQSHMFTDRGFHTVVVPARPALSAYFTRLGFSRVGEFFSLTLRT